jgi:hypothetical protein
VSDINLGIYDPNSVQSKKNASLFANTQGDMLSRLINQQMATLDGKEIQNFNSITGKYPFLSKEVVVGLIKAGANADTPGIDKVTTLDGINQVIRNATAVEKLPSAFNKDKSLFGTVRDAVYGTLKGTTRVGFAALRAPYDYITTAYRDAYAITQGEKGAGMQFVKDLNPATMFTNKTTLLGSLTQDIFDRKDGVDTGSGFFMDPASRVGKEQAKAMQSFGRVNGQSFTIGRASLSTLGADPNSTLYKTASGVIDAVLNVATDPTSYASFGIVPVGRGVAAVAKGKGVKAGLAEATKPGLTGVAREGRKLADAKAIAQEEQRFLKEMEIRNTLGKTKGETELLDARKNAAGKITRAVDNHYMRADQKLTEAERALVEAQNLQLTKHYDAVAAATSKTTPVLGDEKITKFLGDSVISGQQDDIIRGLSQLSADFTNTGKAFPGAFVVEELPKVDGFAVAAQNMDEYALALTKPEANVLDLTADFANASLDEVNLEITRRTKLYDRIVEITNDTTLPKATRDAARKIQTTKHIDSILGFTPDEVPETLATLLKTVAETKNQHAVGLLTNIIEDIWKVDAFSNIRAIHGGTGGIAIVNKDIVAAKAVDISQFLADSMTPGVILDAPKAIQAAKKAVEKAAKARDAAAKKRDDINKKLTEIEVLRDYVAKDPDLIQQIVNNPENTKLKSIMDLDLEIGDQRFLKELYMADAGLIDGIGGPIAPDISKVNDFLLGKRFAIVAAIVAEETSAARVLRLFNNKIDLEVAGALAKAETPDEVLGVLRSHLAAATADPQLARSLTLRGQTALGSVPMLKSTMPVNAKAMQFVEKTEMFLSKQYSRSKVLPLADLDRLGKGVSEWMGTARVPQEIIDETLNKLISASATTTRSLSAVRSKIIDDAFIKAQEAIVDSVNPKSQELKDLLAKELKLAGDDKALMTQYANAAILDGTLPGVLIQDGIEIPMTGAVYAHQFMDDVVRLPDTKPIYRAVKKYEANRKLVGTRSALEQVSTEFNEVWRTAQLAFRISYLVRNVGEMQFRQYLSGHETLLSHPIGYISMMIANPQGNAMQKLATHIARYSNDIMGNDFTNPETAKLMTEAVDEYLTFMSRNVSAGDMRSVDVKTRLVGKVYKVVGSTDPNFHKAFATTLSRFNLDDLMQLVAKADTKQLQDELVQKLITNQPLTINDAQRTNIIEEIYNGSRVNRGNRKVSDFASIFLKDTDAEFSYDNINIEGVRNWLFDPASSASYQTALNNLMGTGQRGIYIRKLLADGVVTLPTTSGTPMVIRMPRYKNSLSVEEGSKAEATFRKQLEQAFPADDMPGSMAIFADSKAWLQDNSNILKRAVDGFFALSAKAENIAGYGPEFRMSYWDHIGRYAPGLGLDDLKRLQKEALKTLAPVRSRVASGRMVTVGKKHQTLRIIEREIKRREKNPLPTVMSYQDAHSTAARMAGEYTRNLFYDASRQTSAANSVRIIFPFIQAHANTIKEWGKLSAKNPRQVYKFGKAYDALTKPGTGAIYDLTGTEYEEGQGFFYKDEYGTLRFRYPLVGGMFSAFAGKSMNAKDALQLTAPVQSLNLAFGSVNPGMPGIGPVAQMAYLASGRSHAFGPTWDIARDWIFPFGEPKSGLDMVLPSWLNKSFLLFLNNSEQIERNTKDWAGYLASTGDFGDNPFADNTARNELFEKAQSMSRWVSFMTGLFQSIAPATPSQEVLASIKTKENKYNFITMTQLYKNWDDISKDNPGNYEEAIKQFADQYGANNLLVILSGSTKSITGTEDAWGFLNQNPEIAKEYATRDSDIVPYFFPGGEAAMSYYNWQVATSRREKLSSEELQSAATELVYNMELSEISNEQATQGYSDIWYKDQVVALNQKYGGTKPPSSIITGRQEARAGAIGRALEVDAFKSSPIYKETKEFYNAYQERRKILQDNRLTVEPDFGSSFWLNTKYREELQTLGNQLMLQNPAFSRMYYSVFSNLLKKNGA